MYELLTRNTTVQIYVPETENSAVHIAVNHLIRDMAAVCGVKTELTQELAPCSIVIGTVTSPGFAGKLADKGVPLGRLRSEGAYRWEAYLHELVDGVLYIAGTDRRGTIYGIYDLCEQLGVSPWYYWADVPVKVKDTFSIPAGYSKADWPSVKYRGIFINDEEELNDWAKLHTADNTIGPEAYERIFELLLRLKGNYIWPAMHVNYFNGNLNNGALAEQMGVVVGTSHCDMLLRSNQNEWEPWIQSKGYTDAIYDYSIEGRNREILLEYWQESVEQNKDYEVSYTMGMRGIHDSGFHTKAIDADGSLSEEEKTRAKVQLLGKIIRDQRVILQKVLGEARAHEALRTFVPYKEVLDLYNLGLDVPEDVTLIWANDNFGHMRRYPDETERMRSGGNGLYYHSSYWAHGGTAMSFLFINSIPLAHTGNELKKSYESGIRNIWVQNIGGLKPLEQDMEFFLRYGWEAGKAEGITKDTRKFTEHWINTNFSGNYGAEATEVYEAFAQVTNVRKIEHMNSDVFTQTLLGDEGGRRLMILEDIFRRGNDILNSLPPEERSSFFQLFLMKIHASYCTNHEFYYADRSSLSYERGNMLAADHYVELSVRMQDYKRRMLHFYDRKMSGGKWEGILTPESFPPPPTAMYPARKPALNISGTGLRVDLWNNDPVLSFSVYGRAQKWIELGNQGTGSIAYSLGITDGADWITVSDSEGTIHTEKRILVSVLNPAEHAGKQGQITIRNLKDGSDHQVQVQIEQSAGLPEGYTGYAEADGYVSIPAAGYDRNSFHEGTEGDTAQYGWVTVPGIGRHEGDAVMAWHSGLASADGVLMESPYLEYDLFLQNSGAFKLEIYRFLTLNSTGRIRFGVGIDEEEPFIVESETCDEWLGSWQDAVFNNGEKLIVELPFLASGQHVLRIYMVDRYVTLTKLVLYTTALSGTNLGPVCSRHGDVPVAGYGLESADVRWDELEQLASGWYSTRSEEVPPQSVLYADRDFFQSVDQIFNRVMAVPQAGLGGRRYAGISRSDGTKDLLQAFGSGTFVEQDGVLAIEAEYALENSADAYLTPAADGSGLSWSHLQAETDGGTGLAMHVAPPGILWENPQQAPAMNYRISIDTPGTYGVWLLIRHYNDKSDSCYLALDGQVQPLSEQFGKGTLHTYNTAYVYYWCLISDLTLTAGEHVFSILARKSQLRVDRIYLTTGEELPPVDADWKVAERR